MAWADRTLNAIPYIANLSYLELGIDDGSHFARVNAKNKISVDCFTNPLYMALPDSHWAPYPRAYPAHIQMTTDEFFNQLSPDVKFDLVFTVEIVQQITISYQQRLICSYAL